MIRLSAQDEQDVQIVSAHLQDALVRYADIRYLKRNHSFALIANRFCWEETDQTRRRMSGLHVENVLNVQHHGLTHPHDELLLSLLALSYEAKDELSGTLILNFSAGISIRLDIECLSLYLRDLGPEWPTTKKPHHNL